MKERDYPEGHPASADFDPDSPDAKAWQKAYEATAKERDYPPGHLSASDTPAEKVGDGYKGFYARDEIALQKGGVTLRSPDVLIAACPLHGDRQAIPLTTYHFDRKALTVEGDVLFPCKQQGTLTQGVWHLA